MKPSTVPAVLENDVNAFLAMTGRSWRPAAGTGGEPDDAGSAVRTRRRVVRVDDAGVGDALVAVREGVRVACGSRGVVSPLVAIPEERVDLDPQAAWWTRKAVCDGLCQLR